MSKNSEIKTIGYDLSSRDEYFMKVIDVIEKDGHCLTPIELEHSEMYLSGDKLPKKYYDLGRSSFLYYLYTYNLSFEDAFENKYMERKDNFIQLVFFDGSLVATKEFLTNFFKYFELRFKFDGKEFEEVVEIEGHSAKHFLHIMKYFYGKRISFNLENVVDLYKLATYFMVESTFLNRLVDYIKYFFPKIMKTRAFYENTSIFDKDFYDMKRLLYLYKLKQSDGNCNYEEERFTLGTLKYRYDVPMSYAVLEVCNGSNNKLVLNRIGGYGNLSEFEFRSEHTLVSKIFTSGNEIFVFLYDNIGYTACYLKLIGNEKRPFFYFDIPIEYNVKHKIIPYKDRFLVIIHPRNIREFNRLNYDCNLEFQIFQQSRRYYDASKNVDILFEPQNDCFQNYTLKKMYFDLGRRELNDYFIFECEDYIYFLLTNRQINNEPIFFRVNITTCEKEILEDPSEMIDPCCFCNYNSTLFFIQKPQREESGKQLKKDTLKTVKGYCYDMKEQTWCNFKQPYVEYTQLNVALEIVNGLMHFFIIKKRSEYKQLQEVILCYTPDKEANWTEIRNKLYDTPNFSEFATQYYTLIRRPGF
ncbi:BTB/POZ-like domain and BTB/POZ fold domain and BTB/POZ domain-containing protein [Strongyloides ratti]|uniref:BTB/POZ-like domain and BTB/POZ fold domain and BTB/POZ domain-containing protein n=1 Tax=Strongyloides ratti TaxID=34506 RepID=A0A090LIL0_STRRB|nr:BTB/POZ-like domain and BTB/POZ fold domain and BTB/POZ domain-containing protein [Strongyloides ratti]CEF67978.1 BTB/POZ-like domain and BTB/POZ fold domain and BTB/POZ domain-containing protein [Strongyloides ratti]